MMFRFWFTGANLSPYYYLLCSIPGVGEMTATTILAEIGDIQRFPDPKQLVTFAGPDPSVFQSGNFKPARTRYLNGVPVILGRLYTRLRSQELVTFRAVHEILKSIM